MTIEPAAEFLLSMPWRNLYEPISTRPGGTTDVRCKGCREILKLRDREAHFGAHKAAQSAREASHREQVKAQRIERLAKAREARRVALD